MGPVLLGPQPLGTTESYIFIRGHLQDVNCQININIKIEWVVGSINVQSEVTCLTANPAVRWVNDTPSQ